MKLALAAVALALLIGGFIYMLIEDDAKRDDGCREVHPSTFQCDEGQ